MAGAERESGSVTANALRLSAVPVLGLLLWWALSHLVFVVPPPLATLRALATALGTPRYLADVGRTLGKIVTAFGLAAVLGVALGSLLGLVRPVREVLEPLVLIVNGIPKIALYPIMLILFGLGTTSQVLMGVIFGTLPVLVTLMAALADMRPVYRKVGRMLEVGPLRAFLHIYMPAVAPSLMVALQLGFSLSVLGVIYAELIASRGGLGQSVIETYSVGNYPMLAASVVVILAISLGGSRLLRWAEAVVLRRLHQG